MSREVLEIVANGPQSLADVKIGDPVLVTTPDEPWSYATIARFTKTLIITSDGGRFIRISPYRYGAGVEEKYGGRRIHVGLVAKNEIRGDALQTIRRATTNVFSPQLVSQLRDACDRAEAALRELGEWE